MPALLGSYELCVCVLSSQFANVGSKICLFLIAVVVKYEVESVAYSVPFVPDCGTRCPPDKHLEFS